MKGGRTTVPRGAAASAVHANPFLAAHINTDVGAAVGGEGSVRTTSDAGRGGGPQISKDKKRKRGARADGRRMPAAESATPDDDDDDGVQEYAPLHGAADGDADEGVHTLDDGEDEDERDRDTVEVPDDDDDAGGEGDGTGTGVDARMNKGLGRARGGEGGATDEAEEEDAEDGDEDDTGGEGGEEGEEVDADGGEEEQEEDEEEDEEDEEEEEEEEEEEGEFREGGGGGTRLIWCGRRMGAMKKQRSQPKVTASAKAVPKVTPMVTPRAMPKPREARTAVAKVAAEGKAKAADPPHWSRDDKKLAASPASGTLWTEDELHTLALARVQTFNELTRKGGLHGMPYWEALHDYIRGFWPAFNRSPSALEKQWRNLQQAWRQNGGRPTLENGVLTGEWRPLVGQYLDMKWNAERAADEAAQREGRAAGGGTLRPRSAGTVTGSMRTPTSGRRRRRRGTTLDAATHHAAVCKDAIDAGFDRLVAQNERQTKEVVDALLVIAAAVRAQSVAGAAPVGHTVPAAPSADNVGVVGAAAPGDKGGEQLQVREQHPTMLQVPVLLQQQPAQQQHVQQQTAQQQPAQQQQCHGTLPQLQPLHQPEHQPPVQLLQPLPQPQHQQQPEPQHQQQPEPQHQQQPEPQHQQQPEPQHQQQPQLQHQQQAQPQHEEQPEPQHEQQPQQQPQPQPQPQHPPQLPQQGPPHPQAALQESAQPGDA
ncbi:hypothetical protein CLOM_g7916 [Closterium sp. NIES-68]|nr:hypothetical protein CLOM_g7916 [Closterium sp. NIES-68]